MADASSGGSFVPDASQTGNFLSQVPFSLKSVIDNEAEDNPPQKSVLNKPLYSDYAGLLETLLANKVPIVAREEVEDGPVIGRGYTMTVKRGRWDGNDVALKILNVEMPINADSAIFRSDQFEEKLAQAAVEIRIMSHELLRAHENITSLLAVTFNPVIHHDGTTSMTPILIVELAMLVGNKPVTLDSYILHSDETVSLKAKTEILLDIAEGLSAMHAAGITHSDIKPSNILMYERSDGRAMAKISDFGFVHLDGVKSRLHGGTLYWTAPECLPSAPPHLQAYREDRTQDIYSFGLLMWFVLFEELPFGPMESFDHERTSALKLGPDLDEAVEAAYSRCFNLRIEIPADALQLELPKGDIMSILDDKRLIDEVRFDKRKKSWVSEKSTYQHLLRPTMELCLVTKPHRRRNAIRIFISEAVSTRYLEFGVLNRFPMVGMAIWSNCKCTLQNEPNIQPRSIESGNSQGVVEEAKKDIKVRFSSGTSFMVATAYENPNSDVFESDDAKNVPKEVQQALTEHCLFVVRSSDPKTSETARRCAHILGQCYSSGFGVDADTKKAHDYLVMAADTDYLFSWVLKHRVIASWSADEQAVSLDQETRIQWYLDVLLPHRNTLQSHGKVDYRDDLRVRIARLKNRTDFEAVLKNTFHSHETRIPNQKVALGYGMDSLDTEIWRAAVSAVRLKLIHQVRALAQRDASILRPVQGKTSILHVAAAYNAASLIRIFIEEFRFPADTEDERGQTPIEVALNFGSITAFLVLYHSSQWPEQLNLARIIFLNAIDGAAQTLTFIQRLHLTIQAQRKSKERSENKFKITKMTKKMRVFFDHKKGVFVQGDPAIPDDFEDEWSQDDIGDVSTDRLLESNLATRNACFHTALIYANWDAFCCHLLLGVNVDLPGFSSSQVKVNLWYSHLIEGYNPDYHLGDLWYTPLQMAAWYNRPLMVAALLSAGADVHARGSQGRTALHMACGPMRSTERLEQWLEDSEERETVVSAAADESPPTKVTTIELLVDAGADIEARDALGFTPLMWAIEFDDFDTADFLLSLEDGANIDATDALSRSALIRACNRNDLKALQYCVRHKADLNLAEYASYTALAIAISDGDDEICKALIEAGADLCTLTDVGDNALQVALRTSHWSLVSLLLSHMESHCSEDEIRQILSHHDLVGLDATAICLIRPLCPEEIFEKIVELSAPWLATSTNFLGENALHIALLYPAFPTLSRIEALLNTGVDPNQLDDVLGWGPVHAAMFRFMVEEEQHYFAKISQLIIDNGGDADLPDHKRQLCASDILEFEATWSEDGGEVGNVSEKWKAHYRDIEEYLAERSRTRAQMGVAVPNNRTRDETKERFSRGGKHRSRRISRMRHSGCYCRLC